MYAYRRQTIMGLAVVSMLLPALTGCIDRSSLAGPGPAPPCPVWVEYPASNYSNRDSIYLGCNSALNLKKMLERPADLEQGETLSPASGQRATLGVETYDQGKSGAAKSAGAP
jgi:type IV pilus biogenesis protein CpaD/CtpE